MFHASSSAIGLCADVDVLSRSPSLTWLNLASPDLVDDLIQLASRTGLTALSLCQCKRITNHGVSALTRLTQLRSLSIECCYDVQPPLLPSESFNAPAKGQISIVLFLRERASILLSFRTSSTTSDTMDVCLGLISIANHCSGHTLQWRYQVLLCFAPAV